MTSSPTIDIKDLSDLLKPVNEELDNHSFELLFNIDEGDTHMATYGRGETRLDIYLDIISEQPVESAEPEQRNEFRGHRSLYLQVNQQVYSSAKGYFLWELLEGQVLLPDNSEPNQDNVRQILNADHGKLGDKLNEQGSKYTFQTDKPVSIGAIAQQIWGTYDPEGETPIDKKTIYSGSLPTIILENPASNDAIRAYFRVQAFLEEPKQNFNDIENRKATSFRVELFSPNYGAKYDVKSMHNAVKRVITTIGK